VSVAGALDAFQIRVGNWTGEYVGRRDAFKDNALCQFSLAVDTNVPGSAHFYCGQQQIGRFVSIQHVDPIYYSQMKLCNVDVLYR